MSDLSHGCLLDASCHTDAVVKWWICAAPSLTDSYTVSWIGGTEADWHWVTCNLVIEVVFEVICIGRRSNLLILCWFKAGYRGNKNILFMMRKPDPAKKNDFPQSQPMAGQEHRTLWFPDCYLVFLLCDVSNKSHHKFSFFLLWAINWRSFSML